LGVHSLHYVTTTRSRKPSLRNTTTFIFAPASSVS
jgi:hypothetical protein